MMLPMLLLGVLTVVAGFVVFTEVGEALGFPGGFGEFLYFEEPEAFDFDFLLAAGSAAVNGPHGLSGRTARPLPCRSAAP